MNQERIKQLEKFAKEDPLDPFPKYALALEYLHGNKKKSEELFAELVTNHPEYVGTYYHAAALQSELGNREAAEQLYVKGIDVATKLNESHALKELQAAYLNFQFED